MVLVSLFSSLVLLGQSQPDAASPIQPDRPNYTNGSHILDLNSTQVEFGYRQTHSPDSTLNDYGDGFTIRRALTKNFEVRIGGPSYLNQIQGDSTVGFGDANIGFKWKTSEAKGCLPSTGLLFTGTFKSGSVDFRENAFQPEVRGLFSFELPHDQSVDANLVLGFPSESGQKYTRFAASVTYGRNLNPLVGMFFEAVEQLPGSYRGSDTTVIDAGLTRLVGKDLQVDAYLGHGFSGGNESNFFGTGISVRR